MGGLSSPRPQRCSDVGNGTISSDFILLVPTGAENALQQVCSPHCVHCTAVHEKMCLWRQVIV